MSLRIRLWPTFFTLLGLAILISLGTWQLNRYLDARSFEAERDARLDDYVVAVDSLDEFRSTELDFRRVRIEGQWDRDRLFLIRHRVYQGDPGYWVVTALRPPTIDDGPALLVNRGWIHRQDGLPEAQRILEALDDGVHTVTGLVHPLDHVVADDDFRDAYPTSSDRLPQGVVEMDTYDLTAIYDSLPYDAVERPVILTESSDSWERELPVASHEHITQPYLTADTHFGYMLTWYLLALALIAIWIAHAAGVLHSESYDDSPPDV